MLCRVCTVHIQPGKHALEHADYKGPTWQHGLDPTDHDYVCMCMCTRYIYMVYIYNINFCLFLCHSSTRQPVPPTVVPRDVRCAFRSGDAEEMGANSSTALFSLALSFLAVTHVKKGPIGIHVILTRSYTSYTRYMIPHTATAVRRAYCSTWR